MSSIAQGRGAAARHTTPPHPSIPGKPGSWSSFVEFAEYAERFLFLEFALIVRITPPEGFRVWKTRDPVKGNFLFYIFKFFHLKVKVFFKF